MTIRDVEAEGFVEFEEKDKDKEVSQEEYNLLVETSYRNICKYGRKKDIPKILQERYDNLKYRTMKIHKIRRILFITNAFLNRRSFMPTFDTFLVFEEENDNSKCFGPRLVYNITSTEDNSFDFDKSLGLVQDESNIITIYQNENKDFQEDIDFGYMNKIIYCKNAKLINVNTNIIINKSDYLEFSDVLGNYFYLDCINNKLYKRYNCFKLEKNKEEIIYEKGVKHNFDISKFYKYDKQLRRVYVKSLSIN